MINTKANKISLKDIELLREEKLIEIRKQKQLIEERTLLIFEPIEPPANKVESIFRTINTGMAIFDGLMLGVKTIDRLKKSFRRK